MITGEVVPDFNGLKPYKVVIKHSDGSVLDQTPVDSIPEGEELIVTLLQGLKKIADEDAQAKP